MISILVYPNITYLKDPEKDSYVIVLGNLIKELNKIRKDLFFTIISPKQIKSLEFDNTVQRIISIPTYPNTMRIHFDTFQILNAIDWKSNDYDLVYSHLPEHTLQLKNLFYNKTNLQPIFIGYSHWSEVPEITNYPMNVLSYNLLGIAEMFRCGINTQVQKDLLLQNAKMFFNDNFIKKLDRILEVQYLGCETPQYKKQKNKEKIIVFNHRAHPYKGYDWFLKQMDKLYSLRKDFRVWVPLAKQKDREYIDTDKYNRFDYFSKLSSCYVGICAKQNYAGWSISATDGMSVGVPYLFADELYYHELGSTSSQYYTNKTFIKLLSDFLDSPNLRNHWSKKALFRSKQLNWKNQIKTFSSMIGDAMNQQHSVEDRVGAYQKISNIIKGNQKISKRNLLKRLGWGVGICFSSYRNALMENSVLTSQKINKDIFNKTYSTETIYQIIRKNT